MANNSKLKELQSKIQHRWVIADTHFFHEAIIKYCNRPFESVKKMNWELIKRWNSVVGEKDLVYILGDFALMYKDKEKIKQIVSMLHGKKCLICGNHDTKKPQYYLDIGFLQASWKPIVTDSCVILSHQPPEYISKDYAYVYGHVHNKPCEQDKLSNCKCVSVERINYTPINLDELIKKMKKDNNLKC